jgi:kynurenine formamidase
MLRGFTYIQERRFAYNLETGIDISIPFISDNPGPNCFFAPNFKVSPLKAGDFIGAIEAGSPVNFYNVQINPHGNGTHTECVGHILKEKVYIHEVCPSGIQKAQLITIKPQNIGNDRVITKMEIPSICEGISTLVIRTLPNSEIKKSLNYSGDNPPYFTTEAIKWILDAGIKHLIVDLPSIDKEKDGGAMAAHKVFWNYNKIIDREKTITEMVYVPESIEDGYYLCGIHAVAFQLDAAPSCVILYPLIEDHE